MLLAHISVTASLKREAAMALSKWDFAIGRDIDGGLGHVLSNQTATFIVLVVPSSIIAVLGGVGLWVWGPVNQTLSGVFVGVVSASVTVILTLILLSIIYYIARKKNHYRFIEFFGTVTTQTRGALLLFAGRRLVNPSEVKWDIKTKIPEIDAAKPKGVSDWFPVQDLRGANYVAGELAKHTNQTAYYRTDADLLSDPIDQIRATVFSFGLGFNQFTHRLAACTEGKLFNVKIADGTDQISIPGMGLLKPHLGIDYSIVVRIAHAPASPTRYYFL